MSLICGSFRTQEEDNYDVLWPFSSPSTRKSTRRRHIFRSRKHKNATNRFVDRGLDKFEALLAELDQKRQKIIIAQKGSVDISMVNFIYNNTNEIEPVVINSPHYQRKHHVTSPLSTPEVDHKKDISFIKADEHKTKPVAHNHTERKIVDWWKPSYYFPLFVIFILVLLMFSGRSFAILCTSIGWYLVPVINKNLHKSKAAVNITKT